MKKISIIWLVVFLTGFMLSCKNEPDIHSEEEQTHSHDEESETRVSLTNGQMEAINIELGKVESKELRNVIKANGFLKAPNQSKAQVTSLYSGQIKSIYVRQGEYVSKGRAIALIENPDQIFVQEQYLTVSEQISLAQTEVNRQKELYEGNAGALKNLQYAQNQLKVLQSQRASLVKQLQMMGINPSSVSSRNLSSTQTVKAPISGVVGAVLVDIGSYVDVSVPIAQLVDNSSLHLDLNIFEKDLPKVAKGQLIHFTLTNNPEKEYDAEIYSIGSTFEDGSKAVPVHARVLNDKTGLIDGMNVVAIISIGESLVPAVPNEAIVSAGAEDFIFVVRERSDDEVIFEKIPVVKGASDVGYSQITPLILLDEGAEIVTKGAFFIMAKLNNTGEEGHAH